MKRFQSGVEDDELCQVEVAACLHLTHSPPPPPPYKFHTYSLRNLLIPVPTMRYFNYFHYTEDTPYSVWPGPQPYISRKPSLQHMPCFSQFINKDDTGKKGAIAKRNLATLTAKAAKTRIQQCKKKYAKYPSQVDEFVKRILKSLHDKGFNIYDWRPPCETMSWEGYRREECMKVIADHMKAYFKYQKQEAKELYEKTVRFYEEKAKELEKAEESLAASKMEAQKTMEEHWEIITNTQWSPLNNPHVLQNVLGFLKIKDLDPVMRTCSQMLHFVRFQVPVSVVAHDMGNKSFNKWLSSFQHFRSLDCSSTKNMKKGSMYRNLAAILQSKRVDSLKVSQPAGFASKSFEKFEQIFQQHQKQLVELCVEASMVPCFLTDEQLGKLKKLILLNLNKDNENVMSWVEKFEKLTSLEVMTISCYDFDLKQASVPANLSKMYIWKSNARIKADTKYGAILYMHEKYDLVVALPDFQHCDKLEEVWSDEVQDLTSLSLLKNPLKVLKIRGGSSRNEWNNIIWPTSLHAKKLALSRVLPPIEIVKTEELILDLLDDSEVMQFVSGPICKELSILQISDPPYDIERILQCEHSLREGVTFGLHEQTQFHPGEQLFDRSIPLIEKYGLIKFANFPNRCTIRSIPIHELPDYWDASYCNPRMRSAYMKRVEEKLDKLSQSSAFQSRKRKRTDACVDVGESPQKKKKASHS